MFVQKIDNCLPIKIWASVVEEGAMEQLHNCASLPFAFHHVVALPDVHKGYGISIGTVMATENVVVPNAVGVDIGCGMLAVKTSIHKSIDVELLKKIMGEIRKAVPVGFNHQAEMCDLSLMPKRIPGSDIPIVNQEFNSARKQLGTLGSGNHFAEIQHDEDGWVWIMIHSGSRNLGKKVCDHYNKVAKELNERWFSSVPKEWDLAFLPLDTVEGQSYMAEMQYCVDFALANRKLMMENICKIFKNETGCIFGEMINIAHNYAKMEHHFGKNVMVHRKGATSARLDEIGIIPGSQGTASYIVKGKGNPDSFMSCSHGAGRAMGRKDATRRLNLEDEIKRLDDQGIIHGIKTVDDLDEASGAYKNVEVVMEEQKDLVDMVAKLLPMAVIKG